MNVDIFITQLNVPSEEPLPHPFTYTALPVFFNLFIYLSVAALDLHFYVRAFL